MGDTAVAKPTLNAIHIQYLGGDIFHTLWEKTGLIGHKN